MLTGASGMLGFQVARLLAAGKRHQVVMPVRRQVAALAGLGPGVETVASDLGESGDLENLFARYRPDVVVHCAASGLRPPRPSWPAMEHFNVDATVRLFEQYCRSGATHFIHVGTGLVYRPQERPIREDDPVETLQPYAATKAAADLLLQAAAVECGRPLTIVRPFAFTGSGDFLPRLFPGLFHAAASGTAFAMTPGLQVRDFCALADIARAIVLCVDHSPATIIEKFNLGGGLAMTLRQWVASVCSELEIDVEIQLGGLPYPPFDAMYLVADIERAEKLLDWRPMVRVSYAAWELAREIAPELPMRKPERFL
jgi:UDP-glucose 4-epimerase